ncbi:YhcN/YlaJ family sporulation lipoprotein [Lentibacillus sp. N15]|uniref:YhcN/YlaJ family sporulation lipoprotein n=1 Tax=Lentibacillus songyuanensis TaxID=3136161 RepID=UPI0031BAD42E
MKLKMVGVAGVSLLMLFGCSNNNANKDQHNDSDTQPIHYETDHEHAKRLGTTDRSIGDRGGYPQSDQSGTNASNGQQGTYSDNFVNQESEQIYQRLINYKQIKQAQIAITEDKVIVGLMLNDYKEEHVRDLVVKEVKKVEPDKEVVIYTDNIHWNRMKNMNARGTTNGHANDPAENSD